MLALGLWAGVAAASDFDGFRIPESRSRSYGVDVRGEWAGNSRNDPGESARNSNAFAQLTGAYLRGFDSDRLSWGYTGAGSFTGNHDHQSSDRFLVTPGVGGTEIASAEDILQERRDARESWNLSGSLNVYPAFAPVGVQWTGGVSGYYRQAWDRRWDDARTTQDTVVAENGFRGSRSDWQYTQGATVTASMIFGRVRVATAIFQVRFLEERLQRDGVLLHALSPAARQHLVDLFALSSRFSFVHDLPDKFFWSEVERVLREDGALTECGLGGYAGQHAEDPLWVVGGRMVALGGDFTRQVGWLIGPYVQYVHAHSLDRQDFASSTRSSVTGSPPLEYESRSSSSSTRSQDDCFVGGQAQFSRPLGIRTQLDLQMSVSRTTKQSRTIQEVASARLLHLVGERWLLASSVSQQRSFYRQPLRRSNWVVAGTAGATWYLEDFLSMNLSFVQQASGYRLDDYQPSGHSRSIHSGVSLGMSLGRGRVDAPALSGPLTALN